MALVVYGPACNDLYHMTLAEAVAKSVKISARKLLGRRFLASSPAAVTLF